MSASIPCAKCGLPIVLDGVEGAEVVLGKEVSHAVCPEEEAARKTYTATVEVTDDEGVVARVSATVEAPTFAAASKLLTPKLGERWDRILESAALADRGAE